ncbi:MAG: ribosome silencing factor [Ilumatobacteraceae bacterium]|jgi:ribosome-associated protein|nr:ribosome silencing factor [Ilumatobacteraceae bacterium]
METQLPVDSGISSRDLAVLAAQALDEKQASDVVVLPVGDVLAITEFFVIASASNKRQVKALADAVLTAVRDLTGRSPLRSEGAGEQQWVLIDYGDVVVHVFADETRRFYEIERLYKDVQPISWQE